MIGLHGLVLISFAVTLILVATHRGDWRYLAVHVPTLLGMFMFSRSLTLMTFWAYAAIIDSIDTWRLAHDEPTLSPVWLVPSLVLIASFWVAAFA